MVSCGERGDRQKVVGNQEGQELGSYCYLCTQPGQQRPGALPPLIIQANRVSLSTHMPAAAGVIFENMARQKQQKEGRWSFLSVGPGADYYRWKVGRHWCIEVHAFEHMGCGLGRAALNRACISRLAGGG